MPLRHAIAALTALLALPPAVARAQGMPCAPREQVLEVVIDRLGQVRQATGTDARIEVFAAPDGRWSILAHPPDGRTCLLASGTAFEPTGGLQPARGRPT